MPLWIVNPRIQNYYKQCHFDVKRCGPAYPTCHEQQCTLPPADINECVTESSCDPNASCTNMPGSFTCECNAGYRGDGNTCYGRCALCKVPYTTHSTSLEAQVLKHDWYIRAMEDEGSQLGLVARMAEAPR